MKLEISGKNVDIGKALPTHIAGSLNTVIKKYFKNVTDACVVMEKQGEAFKADIYIHINKIVGISATGKCGDAYGAFEAALKHAAKRLRRKKRQYVDKHRQHHYVAV